MISESAILNCFQHLVDHKQDDAVLVGSGDDAAVIKFGKLFGFNNGADVRANNKFEQLFIKPCAASSG